MENLITVDDFKTYKNINNPEEDIQISYMIKNVSSLIKNYCSRTFNDYISTDKVEYKDARYSSQIFLDEFPIIDITSIEIVEDDQSLTTLTKFTDYFLDNTSGIIYSATGIPFAGHIPYNPENLKVSYKAGYSIIPEDLKQAALDLVEFYRSEEYTPRKAFSNNSIENLGFRETAGTKFPSHIERILQLYRKL